MPKTIRYQKMHAMQPKEGLKYSTTYVKQTLQQRAELCRHIKTCVNEIANELERDPSWYSVVEMPLKGFKTTQGTNRSVLDILTDMINEARGKNKQGLPKDFAMAPIERWNKLFENTDYAVDLVQTWGSPVNNFKDLMEFDYDAP